MRAAVKGCVRGKETPMTASDAADAELPEGSVRNTVFSPAMPAVANAVKWERRKERGGAMDPALFARDSRKARRGSEDHPAASTTRS